MLCDCEVSAGRSSGTADIVMYAVGAKPNVQAVVDSTVDAELFAAIVGMSIVTTLIVPPFLRRLAAEPRST